MVAAMMVEEVERSTEEREIQDMTQLRNSVHSQRVGKIKRRGESCLAGSRVGNRTS